MTKYNDKILELMKKENTLGWKKFAIKYNLNYGILRKFAIKNGIKSNILPENRDVSRGKYSKPNLSRATKRQKIELNDKEFQILLGSILGDGGLGLSKGCYYPYYSETHCSAQLSYIRWKLKYLKKLDFRLYKYKNVEQYGITTKTHPYFTEWYNKWYLKGKKILNEEYLNKLDIVGLAVWFMDDGYLSIQHHWKYKKLRYRRIIFSSLSFNLSEHKIIKNILFKKWGFDISIYKPKENLYGFYLKSKDTKRFIKMIKPYILPIFKYKIRGAYDGTKEEYNKKV